MKKKLILYPLLGFMLYVLLSSYSSGPGSSGYERTGASSTPSCGGGGCHSSSATSSTTVTLTLLSGSTPVTTYTPGGSYTIRMSGAQTSSSVSLPKFGYQVSAVKFVSGSPSSVGTLSAPTGSHTSTVSGIRLVEHNSALTATSGSGGAGTTYVVDIPWTAPSSGTGCVTLYSILNAVNSSFSADAGDLWNYTSTTVYESVASITGTPSVCVGETTTLSDATPCGTWSSSSSSVASVGTSGVVTGASAGTATISYIAGAGNVATTTVTVIAAPAAISGTAAVCQGLTTTLSNTSGAGTWASSNTNASIGTSSGLVTGLVAGNSNITFTLTSTGCKATRLVTVNPLPGAISGSTNVCVSGTTTLSNAGGGTWTSSNSGVATIGSSSGLVSGVTSGTSTITYTLPTGCIATTTMTVNPLPAGITGSSVVCPSLTITLSNSTGGGTWSSSATTIATIGSGTGIVTGVTSGTAAITYQLGTGCRVATTLTVNAAPPAITGVKNVCAGLTTALTNATAGGTWSSASTTVSVGASTGIVTGVAAGTAMITYAEPVNGCVATTSVVVNPLPAVITGAMSVCPPLSVTLSNGTPGGTWSSSSTVTATINSTSGLVTGVAAGTTTITYKLTTGCIETAVFTVNPLPPAISGTATVCSGSTTTLSNSVAGGTWSSSSTSVTVGPGSGIVTAVGTFGSVPVSYTLPTGCRITRTVTINPLPNAISGAAAVCSGTTITLSNTGGGTWESSNTAVATVPVGAGVVTGIGAGGTAAITYTLATGCLTTKPITVNPAPAAITGILSICTSAPTSLSSTTTGGTWSSSNSAVATITSGGVASGVTSGTSTITYVAGGCRTTSVVTVNPSPAPIGGAAFTVCPGTTVTLSSLSSGGVWSSSNTVNATVGSGSGIVTGVTAGTLSISYTFSSTGCATGKAVTVNPLPGSITGTGVICNGLTTTLTSSTSGGNWTSNNTAVATAGAGTGIITGVSTGTSTISYTVSTGCRATSVVTVNALAPITGTTSLCAGLTTTLSDAIAGGTWSSSNTAVATIGSTSGFLSSIGAGSSIINYTLPNGCIATTTVNVVSSPGAITGNMSVCLGATSALTDAGGGTWTSSNTTTATVGLSTGIVSGSSLGTATITYSLGTGCNVTTIVTVNPLPSAITGASAMCENATLTLSNATGGGTWSSANTNVSVASTGVVTGIAAGTAIISYSLATTCAATKTITINSLPAPITGTSTLCAGNAATLTGAGGGTWTSGTPAVASIGSTSGIVTGLTAGTTNISYAFLATGCATSMTLTVNPIPAAISGTKSVCTGLTTTLSDAIAGGTWSSSNTKSTVDVSTGVVTGVSSGSSVITYTLPTACFTTTTVTVNPQPAAITGASSVCTGSGIVLSDATTGGTWSSSATGTATVGSTSGVVGGVSAGTVVINYTLSTGCSETYTVTVNPAPAPVTGVLSTCVGGISTLTDADPGGTWSSVATTIVAVGTTSGDVSGLIAGTATIIYRLSTGCAASAVFTVSPLPAAITGATNVCVGSTVTLSDATVGGTWASSNTAVATITSTGGVLAGVTTGTSTIVYTLPTGCSISSVITVNPVPAAITGTAAVCAGLTTALTDATAGGTWSSATTTVATVGSGTGVVTGKIAGVSVIAYTLSTGCAATISVTVNALPATITGTGAVCAGSTISLSSTTTGGTWASSVTTVATISTGGVVTGVTAGTTTITYTLATGCLRTTSMTVNPLPVAGTITGPTHVCMGMPVTLVNSATGGSWSSSDVAIATVDASGMVTAVAAGIATISYSVTNICGTAHATITDTVYALPSAGTIVGKDSVCAGSTIVLSDIIAGGVWASSNAAVATVTAGTVTGVAAGTANISYTVSTVCGTATATLAVRVKSHAECNVGVAEITDGSGFKVYPNPTNGVFVVELPATQQGAVITVMDVLGKVIATQSTADNTVRQVTFDLGNFARGSYIIKVNAGASIFRQKIELW